MENRFFNKKNLNILSKILTVLVILATVYFFGKTLYSNWNKIQEYNFSLNWLIVPGLILLILPVLFSGYLWGKILEKLTKRKTDFKFSIQTHIYAWLLKYIPGKTGLVLGKIALGTKENYGKKEILISTVYENIFLVISSFLTSVPFLVFLFPKNIDSNLSVFLPVLFTVPMLIFIYKPVFYFFANKALKLLKKDSLPKESFLSTLDLFKFTLLYCIPRILNGIAMVLIVKSFMDIIPYMYVGIGATFIFSSVIGLLAFLTPGGIGVREAVMSLLLNSYFAPEISVMIALISRLIVTLGDIILLIINLVLNYFKKNSK